MTAPADRPGYRWLVLAMLLVVYTFNFIDRQILGILAKPIKAEMALSDTQLGMLSGIAFALFYTVVGVPVALIADRRSRTGIIALALALWSGFTALCGLASGFGTLFLCRLGVGVGEAGGVAPSYALVSDYFPRESRGRAFAVYAFGIPLGSALGLLLGGWIAAAVGWRTAFFLVGGAGLLFVPLFRLLVREPVRGRFDAAAPAAPAPSFGIVLRLLRGKPGFWLMASGASAASIAGYGLLFWTASFFERSYRLSLVEAAQIVAAITFFGGMIGIWAGGWLGDRLGRARPGAYAMVPAVGFALAAPLYAAGLLVDDLPLAAVLFLIPAALALMWLAPVTAAVQQLVPPTMRATAAAIFLFVNNLIGIGCGTLFMGFVSDRLAPRFGEDSLRWSILAGLGFYLVAAGMMALAGRHLAKDWHR